MTGGLLLQLFGLNIGDECSIRYVLDSTDQDPHPWVGRYSGTNAVITFPNITIVGDPSGGANLTVRTGGPGLSELVGYQNGVAVGPPYYGVQISFAFPDGTITSDALPLELPLSQATTSYFDIYATHHPLVIGTITSYSSVQVPESSTVGLLLLALAGMCARSCGRHQ